MNDDKARQRLGRGLASLIGGTEAGVAPRLAAAFPSPRGEPAGERTIAADRLLPNPQNPRRAFPEGELAELAASIRAHGVVQPILVRRAAGENERFEIVAGERRWRAAQLAGLAEVPAVLRDISDRESLEIALIENVQRADLNALDEALGYERLIAEHGYTQNDLAAALGKSRSHVANTLRLLKLPEPVREMVTAGTLSPGAARAILTAPDPEALAGRIVGENLSVREAEALARPEGESPASSRPRARKSRATAAASGVDPEEADKHPDTRALERLLGAALGLTVDIAVTGKHGSVRIDFPDLDGLDRICRLLQARPGPRVTAL